MPTVQGGPPFDAIARRWCDLAQRRLDYFTELYRSGRWKHYYSEPHFVLRMRDVVRAVEIWSELAGRRPVNRRSPDGRRIDEEESRLRPAA